MTINRRFSYLIGLLALFSVSTSLIVAAPPAEVQPTMQRILREATPSGARVGVIVRSLADGKTWYAYNADQAFLPASTAKIVTASVALEYLGPQYQFTTQLLADGEIHDGVLYGNLYLRGGGDPALKSSDLQKLARAVVVGDTARGIAPVREVRGKLYYDDSFFPLPGPLRGPGWGSNNLSQLYAAPSNALSSNGNIATIVVQGGKSGTPALVSTRPYTRAFSFEHSAMTRAGVATAVSITSSGSKVRISGRLAPGAVVSRSVLVPYPAQFTVDQVRKALEKDGVVVADGGRGITSAVRSTLLAEHRSAPLADLLVPMMKRSDNHMAEQMRWTVLAQVKPDAPLTNRYQSILQEFASRQFSLLGVQLVDGSGLSRQNRITPNTMAGILTRMAFSPNANTFQRSLCVGGVDGTLRRRMTNSPATGHVFAKTGTIRGVSTLAGYVDTRNQHERVTFAIFVNDTANSSAARRLQDRIVSYLASVKSVASTTPSSTVAYTQTQVQEASTKHQQAQTSVDAPDAEPQEAANPMDAIITRGIMEAQQTTRYVMPF